MFGKFKEFQHNTLDRVCSTENIEICHVTEDLHFIGYYSLTSWECNLESCQFHKLDCLPMFLFPAAASGVVPKLVAPTIKVSICFRWIF